MRTRVAARPPALATGIAALALAAGCGGGEPEVEPDPVFGEQPNFVFVLTDDQNLDTYNRRTMPETHRLLARHGTTFDDHVATTPLCCPSRASMLTGQYGHNNGVLDNTPGYGLLSEPENVLPAWLQRVGYRTAYLGKFLNGYEKTVDKHKEVAPGWDEWETLIGSHGYYDYALSVNGTKRTYDDRHLTTDLNRRAVDLVRDLAGDDPFYIQLSHLAPHVENLNKPSPGRCRGDAIPTPRDEGRFADVGLPGSPSINEADASDKPQFVGGDAPLGAAKLAILERRYVCRLESLPEVDRGVADIVRALGAADELKSTVIIFGSDNGAFHGEHRLPGGKGLPYEEASRLPLVMRVPEQFRGGGGIVAEVGAPTANIDLVPTIVELAGAPTCSDEDTCRVMDGRSLVPLLAGDEGAWPAERPILQELDLDEDAVEQGRGISCRYQGVREQDWLYVRHEIVPDPELGACVEREVVELYDLGSDPFELDNLAAAGAFASGEYPQPALRRLDRLTTELADCAGIEGRDPEPESGHYCR